MEDDENKKNDYLKLSISIVTITTPLIYLIGLNFYSGIYYGYGISSNFFSSTIEENLTGAYYFIAMMATNLEYQGKALLILGRTIIVVFIAVVVLLIFELSLKKLYVVIRNKFNSDTYDKNANFNKLKENTLVDIKTMNFTLFLMLIIMIPVTSFVVGKSASIKSIENYKTNKCELREDIKWNRCVTVLDTLNNEIVARGILIAASDTKFAIYSDNKSRIINYLKEYEIVNEYNQ